jgi:hypothetical protein
MFGEYVNARKFHNVTKELVIKASLYDRTIRDQLAIEDWIKAFTCLSTELYDLQLSTRRIVSITGQDRY